MSPLIHWSPSSSNSLEDNSLAVPDAGEVTDAVQTAAVRIPGTSDVQHSDIKQIIMDKIKLLSLLTWLPRTEHSFLVCRDWTCCSICTGILDHNRRGPGGPGGLASSPLRPDQEL